MAALKSSRISMQEEASPAFIAMEYFNSACSNVTAAGARPSSSRFALSGWFGMSTCASSGTIAIIIIIIIIIIINNNNNNNNNNKAREQAS